MQRGAAVGKGVVCSSSIVFRAKVQKEDEQQFARKPHRERNKAYRVVCEKKVRIEQGTLKK